MNKCIGQPNQKRKVAHVTRKRKVEVPTMAERVSTHTDTRQNRAVSISTRLNFQPLANNEKVGGIHDSHPDTFQRLARNTAVAPNSWRRFRRTSKMLANFNVFETFKTSNFWGGPFL